VYPPAQIVPRTISQFDATLHTYSLDFISGGDPVYRRHGIVVPAGATLLLVIQ
jgi:hypothetical protein